MVLALVAAAAGAAVRASRLAMGTVVGVTVVAAPGEETNADSAIEAAYAAIEAGESELSEWRPESAPARMARGAVVPLAGPAEALFGFLLDLRARSGGAFDVMWRGGTLTRTDAGWAATARVDLGGALKGWLNDRAGEALRAAGFTDFLIDAAGDVLAAGNAERGRGWRVDVWDERGRVTTVRLRNQALSTSGNAQQPGHITDARTGIPRTGAGVVSVLAPTGAVADALATAIFAGADPAIAKGYGGRVVVGR